MHTHIHMHMHKHELVYWYNPTWGVIFECCFEAQSSKLESLFSLKRGKRDVRALSFELSKMSLQVGLAVLLLYMHIHTNKKYRLLLRKLLKTLKRPSLNAKMWVKWQSVKWQALSQCHCKRPSPSASTVRGTLTVPVQEALWQCQCKSAKSPSRSASASAWWSLCFFKLPYWPCAVSMKSLALARSLKRPASVFATHDGAHFISIEIRKHSPFQAAAVGRNQFYTSDAHATSLLPPPSRSCQSANKNVFSLLFCAHINSPLNYYVCDIAPSWLTHDLHVWATKL